MATVGIVMFTSIIWAVNCQIAFTMSHFTWIQHLFVWGSISSWYLFLFLYGMLPPRHSHSAYQILVDVLAPAPIYWTATILVTVACNLPYLAHISFQRCFNPMDHYLAHISFQRCFNPMDHHIIQEIKYYKKDIEDEHMCTREWSKARQETKIGFSAIGSKDISMGAEVGFNTTSASFSKYNVGITFNKPDFSATLMLADKGETLRRCHTFIMSTAQMD